jgi:hypothetical protein
VATAPGRALALRALARLPHEAVVATLRQAAAAVPPRLEEARQLAERMAAAAQEAFGEQKAAP